MLMNGVGVTCYAHFVPMLAFDRFNGSMNELNASYKKENGVAGSVVPFFETNKVWTGSTVAWAEIGMAVKADLNSTIQHIGK